MRRVIGFILLGLGAFLLVLAPLARFVIYPGVAKAPIDVYSVGVSEGPGATIFSVADLEEIEVDLTSTRTTRGDVNASTDEVAVYDTFVNTTDEDGETRSALVERAAFDRVNGEAVAGFGENIDNEPVRHEGLVFKFPFDTQQQDYLFWDTTLQEARPIAFEAVEDIQGLEVYRFAQTIEPTKTGELDLPGELVGSTEETVTADRIYANARSLWIEPNTGAIIRGAEEQDSYFEVDGERAITATEVSIGYTEELVTDNVEEFGSLGGLLDLVRNVIPIWGAVAGVVLILVGLLLSRGPREQT